MSTPRITTIIGYSAETSAPNEQPRWGHFTAKWADGAQERFDKWFFERYSFSVVAHHGKNLPEARVGMYESKFEAQAVADAWNRVNGKYGIKYTVEEDW